MPPAVTLAETDFLERTLAPDGPARLLDVPCGNGRHAVELARRGHTLTGVDMSQEFLEAARSLAETAGVAIQVQPGDMRALNLPPDGFDGAYCFGNSFGYLNRTNAEAFLRALARALRPGGKLVIDACTTAETILPPPGLPPRRWHRTGDLTVLSECRYVAEHSRLDIDYTFLQGGHSETRATSSYVMTAAGLHELLVASGFAVVAAHGGMAGEPFLLGSRLLITAQRS